MNNMTCLQYVTKGMNDKIFDFAKSENGRLLVAAYRKSIFCREDQVEEFLIAYNSYFLVVAAMQLKGLPKTPKAVVKFMISEEFDDLSYEVRAVITENFSMLMSYLSRKQKRRLEALFP